MALRRAIAWVLLLLAFVVATPASAQTACQKSFEVDQTGGRQFLFGAVQANAGRACPFPNGASEGSQLRINGSATNTDIVMQHANGAKVERIGGSYYFTPGQTYSASTLIFGTPSGSANPVRATVGGVGDTVVALHAAGVGQPVAASYFVMTVNVRPPVVLAPTVTATAGTTSLAVGQTTSFTQVFENPSPTDVVVSNLTQAPAGLSFGNATASCAGSVVSSSATLATSGLHSAHGNRLRELPSEPRPGLASAAPWR